VSCTDPVAFLGKVTREVDQTRAALLRAREVLAWYADEDTYCDLTFRGTWSALPIAGDCGGKARAVLVETGPAADGEE
jgi:hypothetical protein